MWKFVTSQDCIGKIVGYWEREFSLCLVHSPAYLAEWIKNAWLWLPFYLGHCSGLFTHLITLRNEIMFIPRKREDLLTACSKSGGFFNFNKWTSSAMQTHCLCRIHLGHVLSPLELGAKKTGVNMIILMQLVVPWVISPLLWTMSLISSASTHDTLTGKLSF